MFGEMEILSIMEGFFAKGKESFQGHSLPIEVIPDFCIIIKYRVSCMDLFATLSKTLYRIMEFNDC